MLNRFSTSEDELDELNGWLHENGQITRALGAASEDKTTIPVKLKGQGSSYIGLSYSKWQPFNPTHHYRGYSTSSRTCLRMNSLCQTNLPESFALIRDKANRALGTRPWWILGGVISSTDFDKNARAVAHGFGLVQSSKYICTFSLSILFCNSIPTRFEELCQKCFQYS